MRRGISKRGGIRVNCTLRCSSFRAQWHIIVEGDEIPPPIKNFKDMRFPQAMHCSQCIAGLH